MHTGTQGVQWGVGDPPTSGDTSTGKVAARNAEIDRKKKAEAQAAVVPTSSYGRPLVKKG